MSCKKEDIGIFTQARKSSRRCPNKLLRQFGDSTLIDISLNKLNSIRDYNVYFGAAENEFLCKADSYPNIEFVERSQESANAHSNPKLVFEILTK